MMRIDHEVTENIDAVTEKKVLRSLTSFLKKEKPDVLIFEDYDKGMLLSLIHISEPTRPY